MTTKLSPEIEKAAEEYANKWCGRLGFEMDIDMIFIAGAEHVLKTHVPVEDVMKLVRTLDEIAKPRLWPEISTLEAYSQVTIEAHFAVEWFLAKHGEKLEGE